MYKGRYDLEKANLYDSHVVANYRQDQLFIWMNVWRQKEMKKKIRHKMH